MISFNNSAFNNKEEIEIPSSCEVIFVSDLFSSDYCGGAEMTTDALIDSSQFNVFRLHSKDVNLKLLEQGFSKFWIFGNFSQMNLELIPTIVSNIKYDIVEYDYKYCRYRSPEKHMAQESVPCDCHNDIHGKIISTFFYGAKTLWWMSEAQKDRYHTVFPFLGEKNNTVLSSVFDEKFFATTKVLRERNKDKDRDGWVVLGSNSWIKGAKSAELWCQKNKKKYEVVWDKDYSQVLDILSKAEGFVYLPMGGDTCPRMVIEAKLLGCQLKINDNVQHKDEIWFDTDNILDIESYLYAARNRFWNGVKYSMSYYPTISGYTTTKNCISQNYPFVQSIASLLEFCDQVVVVDGGSDDGTWEKLVELSEDNPSLLVHKQSRNWDHKRYAVFDGLQKALARSLCTSKFCWQQDVDEIVHEEDYDKIKDLVRNFPKGVELLALPVIEYWGSKNKVRMDINPWKWRLSRNLPHITHGIPASLRRFDSNGDLFSAPGSDGCDYIRSDNFSPIQFATFYTGDVDSVKREALTNSSALINFENWFKSVVASIPGVHHYSWFDISRKIKTYKSYWSQHWQSLYDISQDDTSENNMFFDSPWSEISDKNIDKLAAKLESDMGGWIFHKKVDFSNPTPHISIDIDHPKIMTDWIKK